MAKIIAVINDKGGVAKTTTVINLGTALWLLGKKVLLVDADPQCNLTLITDKTAIGLPNNLYTWMKEVRPEEAPVYERYKGLDYIPSSKALGDLEKEMAGRAGNDRQLSLRLNPLSSQYDYILIDCAPGCNTLVNMNAMTASDELILPITADMFSIAGKETIINKVLEIRYAGKELNIAGVLLTKYDQRGSEDRAVRDYYKTMQQGEVAMPLFPVEIRTCVAVKHAYWKQMSIYEYESTSTIADDYMRLAEKIVGIKIRRKTWTPTAWGKAANKAYDNFIAEQTNNQ